MQRNAVSEYGNHILNDREIYQAIKAENMIANWDDGAKKPGKISYGITSFGYDMRISDQWATLHRDLVDPKDSESTAVHPFIAETIDIPPGGFLLGRSVEVFRIPEYVLGIVVGKSTYARCGLIVNCTPMEPGWFGTLTIELHNATQHTIRVYANEGIAQAIFFRGNRPRVTYKDKQGKYNGQTDVTPAKVQ